MASRGRPAIYTPEEAKQRKIDRANAHNRNKTSIDLKVWPSHKARWKAYAKHLGFGDRDAFAGMIGACVERCILEDGWTWEPTEEDKAQILKEAEQRKR